MLCCDGEGSSEIDDQFSTRSCFQEQFNYQVEKVKAKAGGKYHVPISGNMYMFRFLAGFGEDSGLILKKSNLFVAMGLNLIMLVQIIGPVAVFTSAFLDIDFGGIGLRENWRYVPGSYDRGVSYIGQRVLGVFFLVLFIMNGIYVLGNDRRETKRLLELHQLMKQEAQERRPQIRKPETRWLWVGACVNFFCLVSCSIAMCFLFIIADGPKDVLFDCFSLAFLYNLDDIGGDISFLDEKWDEDLIGDMYGAMRDIPGVLDEIKARRKETFTPDNIYFVGELVLYLLLFILPAMFICLEMQKKPEEGGRRLASLLAEAEQVKLSEVSFGEVLGYVQSMTALHP